MVVVRRHHGFLHLLHDYHLVLVLALLVVLDYFRHGFLHLEGLDFLAFLAALEVLSCLDVLQALQALDFLDFLAFLVALEVLHFLDALQALEDLAGLLDCGCKGSDLEEDHHEDHASYSVETMVYPISCRTNGQALLSK